MRRRVLGFTYLVLLAIMVMLSAKDYYLAPIYPLLFAAGGAFWSGIFARNRLRWTDAMRSRSHHRRLIALAPLALPILSPENLIRYENFIGMRNPRNQTGQEGPLPEHFGDEFGWRRDDSRSRAASTMLCLRTSGARRPFLRKITGRRARSIFLARRWDFQTRSADIRTIWLWGPRGYTGEVIIALQFSRDELTENGMRAVEDGPRVDDPYSMEEEHFRIEVCRGLNPSLTEQWPRLRRWY